MSLYHAIENKIIISYKITCDENHSHEIVNYTDFFNRERYFIFTFGNHVFTCKYKSFSLIPFNYNDIIDECPIPIFHDESLIQYGREIVSKIDKRLNIPSTYKKYDELISSISIKEKIYIILVLRKILFFINSRWMKKSNY